MRFSGNQQHAGLSEIFQFRIPNPDRGGKLLAVGGPMIALVERGREMPSPIQVFTENLAQRKLLSFPLRRDLGSKEQLSQATTREIFQSLILDRGGKLLTLGGHMIALVERGREMPSPIQLFTENLAQRKLLSFPPGLSRAVSSSFALLTQADVVEEVFPSRLSPHALGPAYHS